MLNLGFFLPKIFFVTRSPDALVVSNHVSHSIEFNHTNSLTGHNIFSSFTNGLHS